MHRKPGLLRTLFAIALSGGAIVFALQGGGPVSAQVDDPYATTTTSTSRDCSRTPNHPDCRPTTTRPTPSSTGPPNCEQTPNRPGCRTTTTRQAEGCILLSITVGPPGSTVTVTLDPDCFPPDVPVTITFNGQTVLTLPPGSSGQAAFGGSGLAALSPANLVSELRQLLDIETAQASSRSGQFTVPSVTPGTYPVCAIAEGLAPVCMNFTVTGVGGATQGRASGGGSGGGSSGASGSGGTLTGSFARTGLALLPWLAFAAALIAGGVALKRSGHLNRRRITP